jgi:hypothetical protein
MVSSYDLQSLKSDLSFIGGTQMHNNGALISVRQGGRVVLKVAVCCNGSNAPKFAAEIRRARRVPTLHEAMLLALRTNFGCGDCQIFMSTTDSISSADRVVGDGNLHPLCRKTFSDPNFNPLSTTGSAAITEIVDL